MKSLAGRLPEPGISLFLTLGIVLVILVLMTATTIIDVRARRADVREGMMQTGQDFAAIANGVLPDSLRSNDVSEMGQFAAALWAQRDTSYVKIFDRDGRLLVGPAQDQYAVGVRDASVPRQVAGLHTVRRWTDEGLEVIAPVTSGAELVGAVQFGFDSARIDDEIERLTMDRIWQTLLLVCLGVAGSYLFANYFLRPVRRLSRATERLAAGNLEARVEDLRGREMRDLGHSFNRMAGELQDMVKALEDSRARIVSGEEAVRREIATHLHGPVQGRLLALRAQIDQMLRANGMPPETSRNLRGIVDDMGQVIQQDIAVLSRRLYPAIVRNGVVPALQSLADQFEHTLDLELRFDDGFVTRERERRSLLPEQMRLAAYRVTEEALTNVVKHAVDSHVVIQIDAAADGELTLSISDNGPGFEMGDGPSGLGLAAMQDWAGAVGGTCVVTSAPGAGTEVRLQLRWDPEAKG